MAILWIIFNSMLNLYLFLMVLFLSGCAITAERLPDIDKTKPVKIEQHTIDLYLTQNGKLLGNAIETFSEIPEARSALLYRKIYLISGFTASVVSGVMLGYAMASTRAKNRGEVALAGLGLFGFSLFLGRISNNYLRKAAEMYNQKFKASTDFEVEPFLVPVMSGGVAGLSISF